MTPPGSMKKLRKFESQFCNFTNESPFFKATASSLFLSSSQDLQAHAFLAIFTLFLTVLFFPTQLTIYAIYMFLL